MTFLIFSLIACLKIAAATPYSQSLFFAVFLPSRNPIEPPEAFVTLIAITLYFANAEQQRATELISPCRSQVPYCLIAHLI
ncbi:MULTISPECIES: hypothetical protein [unclassified Serratia (in: enterobacteria)]|uniref:hypothetical protein n=1 Tax=unclassified Serratia (in: enterobacteria) TaxID=2647522 RepID=UPI002ED499F5|nr:hypothetical protein [Serratia sp. C2(2)]MEE4446715.1 hypothetical protein [Serratia sp. C2(1)]